MSYVAQVHCTKPGIAHPQKIGIWQKMSGNLPDSRPVE
jgi:hypothetical protein